MLAWSDIFAALRWWLVLGLIGTAALPLAHWLFQRLPDRGYAFSKMLGLLITSYLFWIMGSLGFVGNNLGGILLGLLGMLAASAWAYRRQDGSITWLRENKGYILTVELLFFLVFAVWVWVRAQNPSITATEKPMEFAFLNSVGRSPSFPPLDPWLSGFAISYYYFGYVMISVIARLAAVAEPIAFNLGIAWLVAGSALGAFGLLYNLIALQGEDGEIGKHFWQKPQKLAVIFGLIAAVAIPVAGNGQMLLEMLHGHGIGSADFWADLDINDINGPSSEQPRYVDTSQWWWWRSSRVINEYHLSGRDETGLDPIAEFPGFSFILGDMHPHVLALPFAFLSLALALTWYLRDFEGRMLDDERGVWHSFFAAVGWERLLLTGLILGGLSFLNTWDVLIHLFVFSGAYVLARWRDGGLRPALLSDGLLVSIALVALAYLLYLPFYLGFSSQAGPPFILPMLMRPTRLTQFLVIFGMPLLAIIPFLIALVVKSKEQRFKAAAITAVALPLTLFLLMLFMGLIIASSSAGAGTVVSLAAELGIQLPPPPPLGGNFGWGLNALAALLPTILAARLQYIALTLLLTALVTAVVYLWTNTLPLTSSPQPTRSLTSPLPLPFILLLVLTAALLTLGPEYVYLKDNFGQRLNTIFKFYYQAWIMFGVAALFALSYLLQRVRTLGLITTAAYTTLLAVALLFPIRAVQSRALEFRGLPTADRRPPTLNGLAYVNPDEYAAFEWLRQNTEGTPVILETTKDAYSSYSRVSANTGLPTVLGWANHEYQWRGDSTDEPGIRGQIVRDMFDSLDWTTTASRLNQYNVEYIYVGPLERADHDERGLQKFAENLDIAYQNNSVTIYRWQPQ